MTLHRRTTPDPRFLRFSRMLGTPTYTHRSLRQFLRMKICIICHLSSADRPSTSKWYNHVPRTSLSGTATAIHFLHTRRKIARP